MPLDAATSNPMALDVAADGRIFYVDRLGDVKVIHPAGGTALSGHLNVFTGNESGLMRCGRVTRRARRQPAEATA
jgi:cytochrome c